jgi:hypothetical protein
MPAYFGPWRVISAQPVPPQLQALARKLVGGMLEVGGIPQRQWNLPDGTTIHALIVNGVPKVTIQQPTHRQQQIEPPYNLWAPRGFVVYPAWHDAPAGVGLPIIADGSQDPYSPANMAPGLHRERWTAGGPCGEVLISQDTNAGYPTSSTEIVVPMLFHPTKGPVFQWPGAGAFDARPAKDAWTSYRLELAPPVAHYADESVGNVKAMFEGINAYRAGMPALNLAPRGMYDAAAVMVSIMQAAGSTDATNANYPDTYKTPADRLTKDGYPADIINVPFGNWARSDYPGAYQPMAYELRTLGGSAGSVLTAWQADVDANAALLADVGQAAFGAVGFRGGYWAVNVLRRTRWIAAGNASWQSGDKDLPPVSWHSFASVNLAWETCVVNYDPTNYLTAPLVLARSFTDAQGDCWLRYTRKTAAKMEDMEPALGRHIYCRGRAIAMAPRGGLVWAAAIAPLDDTTDRLLALIHHPEDQPGDSLHEGFTRYLRVWWADIPRRQHLRADPQQTICGEDAADPWGWRGGTQLDLGVMPAPASGPVASTAAVNSLKYASCWRFSPDGTRAICLRDYAAVADYAVLAQNADGSRIAGVVWSAGMRARAVELVFSLAPTTTGVATTFHEYTAGLIAPDRQIASYTAPDTHDTFGIALFESGAYPLAVDYTPAGGVIYAYAAKVVSHQDIPVYPPGAGYGFSTRCHYSYVGIGAATATYATDLTHRVLHGARFQTPSIAAFDEMAMVLDVNSAAFALKATRPRFSISPPNELTTAAVVDLPCQTFTTSPVAGVKLCRLGDVLYDDWYPSPDAALWAANDVCFIDLDNANSLTVGLPPAVSADVQGFYATRFDQLLFGYQCAPTPGATAMLGGPPSGSPCGCFVTTAALNAAHADPAAAVNPRGGRVVSTVPLPDHDWLIYAKVA